MLYPVEHIPPRIKVSYIYSTKEVTLKERAVEITVVVYATVICINL
jgi:hypothetical protein